MRAAVRSGIGDWERGRRLHLYELGLWLAVDSQLEYVRSSVVPSDVETMLRLHNSFQIEIRVQDCLLAVYRTGQIVAVATW
jgi:hypothetical protein